MTKRYREPVEVRAGDAERGPQTFTWRGGTYRVVAVLGHWREDAGWWVGGGIEVPQRDLWRVEAHNGGVARGIYELVAERDGWRLDRVWD